MNDIYCVRADSGRFTKDFINGGYVGIGWFPINDLNGVFSKEELCELYKNTYPNDNGSRSGKQQIGQVARFLFDMKEGDYVITPCGTDAIYYGIVEKDAYYYFSADDGCRYHHRKRVKWVKNPISRMQFSIPFQNSIRSLLTVFSLNRHKNEFFKTIGKSELVKTERQTSSFDYYNLVLAHILKLDSEEFEYLVLHILNALGFEETERTGRPGDGGVDVKGKLDVSGMASIDLFVQAKRYEKNYVSTKDIKTFRGSIPNGVQGAFITTSYFHKDAEKVALEPGFPRIGLINGQQLVDIITAHWHDMDEDFKNKLNLKVGLVPN